MTTLQDSKIHPNIKRKWRKLGVPAGLLVIGGLIGGVGVAKPWEPDHPTALSITADFATALVSRDRADLVSLSTNPEAAGAGVDKILSSLPPGALSIDKISLDSGVGDNSDDLIVTVRAGNQQTQQVEVGLLGQTGASGEGPAEWGVIYN